MPAPILKRPFHYFGDTVQEDSCSRKEFTVIYVIFLGNYIRVYTNSYFVKGDNSLYPLYKYSFILITSCLDYNSKL